MKPAAVEKREAAIAAARQPLAAALARKTATPEETDIGCPVDAAGIGCPLMARKTFPYYHTYESVIMEHEDVIAFRFGWDPRTLTAGWGDPHSYG